ncbi:MAG: M16 family metallopeptidase [Dehalococcoidia bacterium]
MYQKSCLDNGLRIITSTVPHTRSVCLSFYIGTGSRYEREEEAGISHFVEHLCFKGTQRRATAKEISEAIEGVGGILNGGTDKELTVYWCKVAQTHFPLALDILSDMILHSHFHPEAVEMERQVILEEINMGLDSPPQRVNMLIDEVLWPHQALGQDVAGSRETVSRLSPQSLVDYRRGQYLPSNTVVSVAGDIDPAEVVASLGRTFGPWRDEAPRPWFPADDGQDTPRMHLEYKDTEQAHLCLALRGLSSLHPQRFILDLLNVILGEGMSSRLFLEIRERQGLAYDIGSYVSHFRDSGSLIISAGVDPKRLDTTIAAILEELARLREPIPEEEITKAKEFAKGRLFLHMEDTRNIARWTGAQELLTGRILTVDEVISIIDSLTARDLQELAQRLVSTQKLNLAVVGPLRNGRRLKRMLRV